MTRAVHLVGSVPLENAETVMSTCCSVLGDQLSRVPDGETGIRTNWIHWQRELLGSHPAIELVGERKNAETAMPKFAVKGDFSGEISFDTLGYFSAAIESYEKFKTLREQGKIGKQRFQVSLPTPLAAIACYVDEESQQRVFAPYKDRLLKETKRIIDTIPNEQLAIQWDVAIEFAVLEGLFSVWFEKPFEAIAEQLVELADLVPPTVEVGYHFCYGDSGNKHFKEPEDMKMLTALANQVSERVHRTIDWIHMPVPINRSDADYFQPLENFEPRNVRQLFLGLLHEQDGVDGARKRMASADVFLKDYGVATECGLGRRNPEVISELLELHKAI